KHIESLLHEMARPELAFERIEGERELDPCAVDLPLYVRRRFQIRLAAVRHRSRSLSQASSSRSERTVRFGINDWPSNRFLPISSKPAPMPRTTRPTISA